MKNQAKDTSLFTSIPLNKTNLVDSFDLIGWCDPKKPKPEKAIQWLKSLTHDNFIYPMETFDPNKPPVCIFVPEEKILNKMIETVSQF